MYRRSLDPTDVAGAVDGASACAGTVDSPPACAGTVEDAPACAGAVDGAPACPGTVPEADVRAWRLVVEAIPGAVLLLNGEHVCTYASPGLDREFGIDPGSVVGIRPEVLADGDQFLEIWRGRAAVAAGASAVTTRVQATIDGRPRWFESTMTEIDDRSDPGRCVVVHVRDVSAEVAGQAFLNHSTERYHCVLGAIDEAVLQLDAGGRIESFNPRALGLLRRTPDQLVGAHAVALLDLRHADGRPFDGAIVDLLGETDDDPEADGAWRSIALGDGERLLVRVKIAVFDGPAPAEGGVILLLTAVGTFACGPRPTPAQARLAAGLTAREGDVLEGLAAGGDVPTIARTLGISIHSVRGHVKNLTAKLGVHSQLQAVVAAVRRGLVDVRRSG